MTREFQSCRFMCFQNSRSSSTCLLIRYNNENINSIIFLCTFYPAFGSARKRCIYRCIYSCLRNSVKLKWYRVLSRGIDNKLLIENVCASMVFIWNTESNNRKVSRGKLLVYSTRFLLCFIHRLVLSKKQRSIVCKWHYAWKFSVLRIFPSLIM